MQRGLYHTSTSTSLPSVERTRDPDYRASSLIPRAMSKMVSWLARHMGLTSVVQ
ncbi:hypothetical protein O988_07279, partial [Pseudogymnoascus sp. VKM F-3808]